MSQSATTLSPEQVQIVRKLWPSWVEHAACARPEVDPDDFFAENNSDENRAIRAYGGFSATERRAKAVCARCPVRVKCLAYAMLKPRQPGIWGGATQRERAQAVEESIEHLLYEQMGAQAKALGLIGEVA